MLTLVHEIRKFEALCLLREHAMKTIVVCAVALAFASAVRAADTLDIYVVDTEGGKAIILLTPDGETMLVDAGYPTEDDRDTKRVVEAARSAGISKFDYVVATHYDADHSGNVPSVDRLIPGKVFVDHGDPMPNYDSGNRSRYYDPYIKAIAGRKRMSVKPGDVIPIKGCRVTVVSAGGKVISQPLSGGGEPNAFAPTSRPGAPDGSENAGSVGLLYEFGKFRMLDLADLLSTVEYDLACPRNLIGSVDLFMVSHHGLNVSNARFLVHALRPKVILMNNGAGKGGAPDTLDILKSSPGLQDLWQLHYSIAGGDKNAAAEFIANPAEPCGAKLFKVTVQRSGAFTVTNTRNNVSRAYPAK
jgi:beta-lactamase superfamily II metal-dependent hydrolase